MNYFGMQNISEVFCGWYMLATTTNKHRRGKPLFLSTGMTTIFLLYYQDKKLLNLDSSISNLILLISYVIFPVCYAPLITKIIILYRWRLTQYFTIFTFFLTSISRIEAVNNILRCSQNRLEGLPEHVESLLSLENPGWF